MSSNQVLLVVLAVMIGLWLVSIFGRRARKVQRANRMAAAAAAAGLQRGPVALPLGFLNLFMGDAKWVDNEFTSLADLTCTAKGFTHCYTLATAYLQGVALPTLRVARRHTPDEDPLFGGTRQKVELESIEFTDHFVVHAEDPRSAVMLLDLQMMQFILDGGGLSFAIMGNLLVAYVYRPHDSNRSTPGSLLSLLHAPDVSQVDPLLKFVSAFPQHVPAVLRSDYPSPV